MSTPEPFERILARAIERKGGERQLKALIGEPLNAEAISQIGDDRFLAEFTKKVFQSGFVWRVVRQKWPEFEALFFGFDVEKVLLMPDEMLERKAADPRIIRNYNKVKTIRDNALMIADVQRSHGSFASFVAQWPAHDIIGLWDYLKKHGARLGGNTGPYALRFLGKDTFLLSKDVEDYFTQHQLIEGSARSKRSLNAINQTFLDWQAQSGWSLQGLSQLVAYSCGDNHIN
ncbi:DNA-3-methyladenine glycosylase I [Alteromonas oceanisediminis]|uniref:DNA-3-methyladenine glycosylase I n=1 Tax=Alteromonas oceanisediminis TaxID=2836180 RepID=UPI001BDB45E6|nr:DNA-3-methyladenine glycosylase I [Alteromonas oceanisediminis]MBT0587731.1 DNA-3-methyladenine glycosylase I [Alteromonas oceanisediminis]